MLLHNFPRTNSGWRSIYGKRGIKINVTFSEGSPPELCVIVPIDKRGGGGCENIFILCISTSTFPHRRFKMATPDKSWAWTINKICIFIAVRNYIDLKKKRKTFCRLLWCKGDVFRPKFQNLQVFCEISMDDIQKFFAFFGEILQSNCRHHHFYCDISITAFIITISSS